MPILTAEWTGSRSQLGLGRNLVWRKIEWFGADGIAQKKGERGGEPVKEGLSTVAQPDVEGASKPHRSWARITLDHRSVFRRWPAPKRAFRPPHARLDFQVGGAAVAASASGTKQPGTYLLDRRAVHAGTASLSDDGVGRGAAKLCR